MEQRPTHEEPLDQSMPSLPPDYDGPWKEAIEQYFPAFMAFFFPDGLDEAPRGLKLAPRPRLSSVHGQKQPGGLWKYGYRATA